ncbi:ribosomal protein L7Ae/L30e/S12e/Gadd45 [Tanacetum coccineum]
MQEELNQFIANDVWELVPQPRNMKIIGTKWVFRNKLDKNGIVSRNKARLVAQGYNQQEGIDYDETYAPVARLKSIRILLAYACALDFKLFQMDVKSAFLNDLSMRRFETYVKSKDLNLWLVITDSDFPPIQNNPETKKDEIVYEEVIKKDSETVKSKREQKEDLFCLNLEKDSSDEIIAQPLDSEEEEITQWPQVTVQTDEYGYLVISFMIQHEFITLTLAQFGQILKIPYNGQAVFTNEWDLGSLEYSQETEGPYSTDLPPPDDFRRLLELERVMVDHTIKSQTVTLTPNQILTKELSPDMKQWEELIRENVFGLGGHRDHLPACLAHMLYCVVAEEQYNLAYFFVKRIECARANPTANLPYGMFLTRLYRHIMEVYPHLDNGIYDIVDRVMRPLALKQTRRPRSDRGKARHSVSSSSSHHHGTSSHQHDDDDDDVETSRASTPSPTTYLNSLNPLNYQNYEMPSASEQTDETLFERQTTLLNQTQEMHKEMRGGFKSFGKALKGVFSKKKK